MPTLYSALAVAHFAGQSLREHQGLFEAMAHMNWDGEPIDGMSAPTHGLLAKLGSQTIPSPSTSRSSGSASRPGTKLW